MTLSEFKERIDWLRDMGYSEELISAIISNSSVVPIDTTGAPGICSEMELAQEQDRISAEKIIYYEKGRDRAMEPIRKDYNIGTLLLCPRCENNLRKADNYCSRCGQKIEKWK